jgi:excisionase family DNA binding protein
MHEVFTVPEVAALLKADPSTLRKMLREGRLGGFRIGTDWRIPRADLDAFIERNRNSARPTEQPQDDDDDAYWAAEADAALDRLTRGEEKVWTFAEWKAHCNALDG